MIDESFSDRQLVRNLLSGDEEAFELFVDEYYPRVYRFATSRLRSNSDLVDDIVQTTFQEAISSLGKFRGEAALFTWLCSICRYKIYEMLRKRGREQHVELVEENPDVRAALESLSGGLDARQMIESKELAHAVRVALDHLPIHYERALRWKYIDNLSTKEVGHRLNLGAKAAESLLTRARVAFRDGFSTMMEAHNV